MIVFLNHIHNEASLKPQTLLFPCIIGIVGIANNMYKQDKNEN